ncbi:hypothetical protein M758_2G034100 [Ceratodon purpureus]|nr:hypothetical protein M758_2G034100 [Ceratodon purpureus]
MLLYMLVLVFFFGLVFVHQELYCMLTRHSFQSSSVPMSFLCSRHEPGLLWVCRSALLCIIYRT